MHVTHSACPTSYFEALSFTRRRYFFARMMPPQNREQYFAQGFCGVNRFLQEGFSQVIYAPIYKSRLASRP